MDKVELPHVGSGSPVVAVSQANPGLLRRDHRKLNADCLRSMSCAELIKICKKAGKLFVSGDLPLDPDGPAQSSSDYITSLSATTGLPHALCQANMKKIYQVFTEMETILSGLTRGLNLNVLDKGHGEQAGIPLSFFPVADALTLVLPSNSPGVNSIWMPSLALKTPVVLKPGREEPWTPYRIIQALIAAGCPREAFSFYPTSHEGSAALMDLSQRALIFGDQKTVERYAMNPSVQVHGPGWSKVLVGDDMVDDWPEFIDVIVESIVKNGGRSCINASTVLVPRNGRAIAQALAEKLAEVHPGAIDDPNAQLAGFANPAMAECINESLDEGLKSPGAEDLSAPLRNGDRHQTLGGSHYLLPTVIWCDSIEHPLAKKEFMFPYASVVEVPQEKMLEVIGPTLVATAITADPQFSDMLLRSADIDRLNLGYIPTTHVEWNQPHEGNLFEFLYKRRAIQERQPVRQKVEAAS
jgi:hypothetical protein